MERFVAGLGSTSGGDSDGGVANVGGDHGVNIVGSIGDVASVVGGDHGVLVGHLVASGGGGVPVGVGGDHLGRWVATDHLRVGGGVGGLVDDSFVSP